MHVFFSVVQEVHCPTVLGSHCYARAGQSKVMRKSDSGSQQFPSAPVSSTHIIVQVRRGQGGRIFRQERNLHSKIVHLASVSIGKESGRTAH